MLGILLTYHSFHEFFPSQYQNLKRNIKVPFKIYFIDNSLSFHPIHFPDVVYLECKAIGSPSYRHQESLNMGLSHAWPHCDSFLLLDNDMIFLDEWTPPDHCLYVPQRRGTIHYAWPNLFYFPKDDRLKRLDFTTCPQTKERTDSGGSTSTYLKDVSATIIDTLKPSQEHFPEYVKDFTALCQSHSVDPWYDVFRLNSSRVFHFRALSNWTNYPESFQRQKKGLIFKYV